VKIEATATIDKSSLAGTSTAAAAVPVAGE